MGTSGSVGWEHAKESARRGLGSAGERDGGTAAGREGWRPSRREGMRGCYRAAAAQGRVGYFTVPPATILPAT